MSSVQYWGFIFSEAENREHYNNVILLLLLAIIIASNSKPWKPALIDFRTGPFFSPEITYKYEKVTFEKVLHSV